MQDDATLIELLRAVLHNQLQDGNVEGAPVHYSGPSSDPDGALLGLGPALHLQQQHALQGGPSPLMGSNGFTQDDCFNQPFSDWQQGRQFGERGSGLNVLQEVRICWGWGVWTHHVLILRFEGTAAEFSWFLRNSLSSLFQVLQAAIEISVTHRNSAILF